MPKKVERKSVEKEAEPEVVDLEQEAKEFDKDVELVQACPRCSNTDKLYPPAQVDEIVRTVSFKAYLVGVVIGVLVADYF